MSPAGVFSQGEVVCLVGVEAGQFVGQLPGHLVQCREDQGPIRFLRFIKETLLNLTVEN